MLSDVLDAFNLSVSILFNSALVFHVLSSLVPVSNIQTLSSFTGDVSPKKKKKSQMNCLCY